MIKNFVNISACAFLLGMVACSKETAGITEEGNPIAENSSSSIEPKSSSSAKPESSASYKFDLWNGADGSARINMGDGISGYWFSVDDDDLVGKSSIRFPVSLENEKSPDAMKSIVSYCGGVCGTVELGDNSDDASAGVGIALAEKDTVVDISKWDGLCISYESALSMKGLLGYKDGDGNASTENMPYVTFENTEKGTTESRCAKWGDFKMDSESDGSGADVSKKATSLIFKFLGKAKESGFFNIKGVSSYKHGIVKDTIEQTPCLWNGAPKNSDDSENTGYDGLEGGFWYEFTDADQGGSSTLKWDVASPSEYMSAAGWVTDLVNAMGGLSAQAVLKSGSTDGYAGIGLQIVGLDAETDDFYPKVKDVSDWKGLCVTYMAEMDMRLTLVSDSTLEASTTLPMSTAPVEKCVTWADMSAEEVAKNARVIEFELTSAQDTVARLDIIAVGKFSLGGTCSIDESKVTLFPIND